MQSIGNNSGTVSKKPRRLIEEVFFENSENLGPLSIRDLLAMPRDDWESLRNGITDWRHGKGNLSVRCARCFGPVYITKKNGRPLFAHYQDSDSRCPWYSGKNIHPNQVRALQYRGQQESEMHRRMCSLIAELAALDARCKSAKVEEYLPPTKNEHGRYPDALIDWEGFGRFAVEYQMSHTFQTEVSQRCIHYEREGINLLWILSTFDPECVPQAVSDVVHRHRGNAFVLDQRAIRASRQQNTLVLNCFLRNGEGYDGPKLVRFDSLTFPGDGRPFWEDRLVAPWLAKIEQRRLPYFDALRSRSNKNERLELAELQLFSDRQRVDRLVAAAFSIVEEAAGRPQNFASDHPNIKGMLNTFLNTGSLAPYSRLLTALIGNTSRSDLLSGTVGQHLERAITGHFKQVDEKSAEWKLLRDLFPEVLDPNVRQRLDYFGALPSWAVSC